MELSEMLEDLPALSSLPAVINELDRALADPQASMDDFGEIIRKDTDLTIRLLKLANSAFYGFPQKVETVQDALSLIGIQQIKQLLTGSMVIDYFKDIPEDYVNMRSFWEHSIACGLAAKTIAIQRRSPDPEIFFVAGLIHDIGRLVMLIKEPKLYSDLLRSQEEKRMQLYKLEREVFGFDHTEVAEGLLNIWTFPNTLKQAVRYHHVPTAARVHSTQAAAICLADFIVHALELGDSGENFIPAFNRHAWDKIGMPQSGLSTTVKELDKQFSETIELFVSN